jgi:hypothetical protein
MSIPADNRITTITVAAKANLRKIIKNHNLPTAHPTLNVQSTDVDLECKYMRTLQTGDAEDTVAAALVADHSSTPVHLTCASTPSFLVVTFLRTYLAWLSATHDSAAGFTFPSTTNQRNTNSFTPRSISHWFSLYIHSYSCIHKLVFINVILLLQL